MGLPIPYISAILTDPEGNKAEVVFFAPIMLLTHARHQAPPQMVWVMASSVGQSHHSAFSSIPLAGLPVPALALGRAEVANLFLSSALVRQ